jgi:hypothetical protein
MYCRMLPYTRLSYECCFYLTLCLFFCAPLPDLCANFNKTGSYLLMFAFPSPKFYRFLKTVSNCAYVSSDSKHVLIWLVLFFLRKSSCLRAMSCSDVRSRCLRSCSTNGNSAKEEMSRHIASGEAHTNVKQRWLALDDVSNASFGNLL